MQVSTERADHYGPGPDGEPAPTSLAVAILVAAALFVAVWAVGVVYEEFYPAPIFPGFGRIPDLEAGTESAPVRFVVVETASGPVSLSPDEAFPGPPDSFYLPMLDSLIEAEPSAELRDWARSRVAEVDGIDQCPSALAVVEAPADNLDTYQDLHRIDLPDCAP